MKPQYFARQSSSDRGIEAAESQRGSKHPCGYLFATGSHSLVNSITQVTYTSKGTGVRDFPVDLVRKSDRKQICLRQSNWLPYSVLHSQHPLAQKKHRLKSSLWLIPRRSQWSQYTQVSTSNLATRQAFAPASTPIQTHLTGGASWH